ncbi:MAG: hypothetical protein GC202_09675 [Alphaproteobacteria bacterium]|nr:hypothetical protein [Alphaproteobacteria bacterium]
MLVALKADLRIEASEAQKGDKYICPGCGSSVVLKRGRIRIAHFSHRPPINCSWARGETIAHMNGKKMLFDSLRARNLAVEIEAVLSNLTGADRRADVLVTSPRGFRVAIEIQHSNIDLDNIFARTRSYMELGIGVVWIGMISGDLIDEAEDYGNCRLIERYQARPWERWVCNLPSSKSKGIWYLEYERARLWRGQFEKHEIDVPDSSFRDEYGEEVYVGGYTKTSKRWRELWLEGPFQLSEIRIGRDVRKAWSGDFFEYPGGVLAKLIAPSDINLR